MARIRNQRHPRVAYQRDFRALLQRDDQLRRARDFIVLVVADERLVNVIVSQELLRVARIFAGDLIRFFQYAQRAQGDVLEVADGRSDKVQTAARNMRRTRRRVLRAHAEESSAVPTYLGKYFQTKGCLSSGSRQSDIGFK